MLLFSVLFFEYEILDTYTDKYFINKVIRHTLKAGELRSQPKTTFTSSYVKVHFN